MKIIIYGGGKTGHYLTRRLTLEGHDVSVIEKDEAACQNISSHYDVAVIKSSGIKLDVFNKEIFAGCDLFIAVSSVDELNIMSCSIAKKLGIPRTVARVRNEDYEQMQKLLDINSLGVDLIIYPENELANELIDLIKYPNAIDVHQLFKGEVLILSTIIKENSKIVGKSISEISEIFSLSDLRAILVEREDEVFVPGGNYKVNANDKVYSVCKQSSASTIFEMSGYTVERNNNIMINGSGKIAKFIAGQLEKLGDFNIKVIVEDEETATEFSEELPNTLVVFGQATDIDILAAEGIIDMDFFLALTDNDEKNIVSSLFANHLQVNKTITRIEKTDYLPVTKTIGLRRVINSPLVITNTISRFVRQGKVLSSFSLRGVNFEMITYKITSKCKYLDRPLKDVHGKLPSNSLIAVISREDSIIIPTGEDEIKENDKVIFFVEKSSIHKIEKMFGV